ncbi:DUF2818 family protein [Orrella sp. NBD-18]|uniref:DUF2818 family protein n=1 Tax=Sheuella amnicola TaxID=2707330 RepID=A0A6B2QZH1_9BURK|nr:DUF2818 family protein [Sheuella amnicola]NDY82704.1 DUF2818 family protein [Sheuella amnicola]HBI83894.1 DUF2818 domain-containing protein [Alcaligenaceae bacterium]
MNQTSAVWFLIVLALLAANVPFLNDRLFAIFQLNIVKQVSGNSSRDSKPFWLRLFEMTLLYVLVGSIGFALESTMGNPFRQKWEFYAITFSLFMVMGFPGFVLRYLLRRD